IRGTHIDARDSVFEDLQQQIQRVAAERGLEIELQLISKDKPVQLDAQMVELLTNITQDLGYSYEVMPSGAGHDAMHLATLCPTGMIFVPSHLGISHNPLEFTSWEDIEAGIRVLQQAILKQAEVV
ncbi:MAG: M20/M25/M40 family metallo-hydrolase, partial [[Actinobacillus] rossii]|nr:M20/M25/M40 family metallo-hydrolase [[Actinobacillus] rossii]